MANDKPRPILITIIAILEFIAGIIALGIGILTVISGSIVGDEIAVLGAYAGTILIVAGIIAIIIAGGFWNGWKIMWYLGLIFSVLYIIMSIAGMVMSGFQGIGLGAIVYIIINVIIIWYLFRPHVKEFFGL